MHKSMKTVAVISLVLSVACVSQSLAAGELSEITATPDGRRIAITSDSPMGRFTEQVVANPARLVIDIDGIGVSQLPRISGLPRDASLNIRTAKTASGARVVLDFGGHPVPNHKMLKMGRSLIVTFNQAVTQQEVQVRPRVERPRPRETVAAVAAVPVHPPRIKKPAVGRAPNPTDLSVQSAEIVDGLIVLKLTSKTNPGTTYRVDLGVDFQQMGFSTARIVPVQEAARSSASGVEPVIAGHRQLGPRRLQTHLMANSAGLQEESIQSGDEE
jgi:hypothetical protein